MAVSALDPKTALIIIDLQKGIASYPLVHPISDIVQRANKLSAAFRSKDLPVVLVVVDGVAPGRTEQARRKMDFPPGWSDLIPELDQRPDDLRVTKKTPGAFAHTGLEEKLRALGTTQVVIVGVATAAGVDSTARQAYELGFNVTLPVDAMTDASIENHDYAISKVFPRLGETGTTQDVLDALKASS